ncbi:MAG: hypothetical protein PHD73_08415 [Sediminibacterium sp.]|nr:hypothetical protein [Sediminibacterium sp.]
MPGPALFLTGSCPKTKDCRTCGCPSVSYDDLLKPVKWRNIGPFRGGRANSNLVYAIVETEKSKSGLYRSADGGKKWTMMSNDQNITSRGWYYMEVMADPKNENVVYVLNAPLMKSIDGGKTFANVKVGHGDTHDLWINPENPANLALAGDGGGEITYNTAIIWSSQMNQPTAQFYRVNTDNLFPYRVYGGQQDNTSVMTMSRTNTGGISERD